MPSAIFWGTFCSVLACASLPSSNLFCASRWLKLKSANFELLTSAGENQGRDLISQFEQVIERVAIIPVARTDEAFQSYCLLAYAYLGLGEIDKAEKSAADARPNARTSAEVSEVESLFRSLTARQEADAQRNHEPVPQPLQTAQAWPIENTVKSKSTPEVVPAQTTPTPQSRQAKNQMKRFASLVKSLRRVIETAGKRLASLIGSVTRVIVKGKSGGKVESYYQSVHK